MIKNTLNFCKRKKEKLLRVRDELSHDDVPSPVLISGSRIQSGSGWYLVINVGWNSAIGKIEKYLT